MYIYVEYTKVYIPYKIKHIYVYVCVCVCVYVYTCYQNFPRQKYFTVLIRNHTQTCIMLFHPHISKIHEIVIKIIKFNMVINFIIFFKRYSLKNLENRNRKLK